MTTAITFSVVLMVSLVPITAQTSYLRNGSDQEQLAFASPSTADSDTVSGWYVGKGIKAGTYVQYSFQENKTNNGKPFDMTLYFKRFDNASNYWLTSVYIKNHEQNSAANENLISGVFHLDRDSMVAMSITNTTAEMEPYKLAYNNSLDWIVAFFHVPGLALGTTFGSSGKISAPPFSLDIVRENVTVPAGVFNTTIYKITGRFSQENYRIWLNNDQPYPVKGQIPFLPYVDGKLGNASLAQVYSFELLAYGESQQDPPPVVPEFPLSLEVLIMTTGVATVLGINIAIKRRT